MVLSGVVLAAGRSERMGRDKALLATGGLPWWQQRVMQLREVGAGDVWLSVRADQAWARGLPDGVVEGCVVDSRVDVGPLAGVVAGLQAMRGSHLLVVAVDLPELRPAWWRQLIKLVQPGVGAVGRWDAGAQASWEPLAAVYPKEALVLAAARMARGAHSLQGWVDELEQTGRVRPVAITAESSVWLKNVNHAADL